MGNNNSIFINRICLHFSHQCFLQQQGLPKSTSTYSQQQKHLGQLLLVQEIIKKSVILLITELFLRTTAMLILSTQIKTNIYSRIHPSQLDQHQWGGGVWKVIQLLFKDGQIDQC